MFLDCSHAAVIVEFLFACLEAPVVEAVINGSRSSLVMTWVGGSF